MKLPRDFQEAWMQAGGIFRNLIRDENDYTDLLCNLMTIPAVRAAFMKLLGDRDFLHRNFATRNPTEEGGIPDISYEDDDRSYLIEVKVHISTSLTGHQPLSYLKHLLERPKHKERKLFFLVPSGYQREADVRDAYSSWPHKKEIDLRFVYWENFYTELTRAQPPRDEGFDSGVFRSFLEVLASRFYCEDIKMDNDTLMDLNTTRLAIRYDKVRTIVKNARMRFVNDGAFDVEEYWDSERCGFNVGYRNRKYLFFAGMVLALWKESEHALAILADSEEHAAFYQKLCAEKAKDFSFEGRDYRYLSFTPSSDDSDVVNAYFDFILHHLEAM